MLTGACISPTERAYEIAASYNWKPVIFKTEEFTLLGFLKKTSEGGDNKEWVIYIEGDGHAWKNRHTLSDDPTPRNPMGLRLAVLDPAPNVLYLGRPCQYMASSSKCHQRYWSTHRYSTKIIKAVNDAIDQAKEKYQISLTGLVGYSGGGVIAALVAAQRNDVKWLATVCANLDHRAWTDYHHVTPLNDSLNPADFTKQLQFIPQIHLVGKKDNNVPESVVRSYQGRMTDKNLTKIAVIPGYDHYCCWPDSWQQLKKQYPKLINIKRRH